VEVEHFRDEEGIGAGEDLLDFGRVVLLLDCADAELDQTECEVNEEESVDERSKNSKESKYSVVHCVNREHCNLSVEVEVQRICERIHQEEAPPHELAQEGQAGVPGLI